MAIGTAIAIVFTAVAWLIWRDHRPHAAGILSLGDGRVYLDAWDAVPLDGATIADVVRAFEEALRARASSPRS